MSFFAELKRRNVFRVAIAYGVASWVLLQIVDLVLDNITAPDWVMHVFMLAVGLGFVVAVIIAWAYELTPEGIKREADVDRSQSVTGETGHKLDRIIIGFLAVAVVLLLADRFVRPPVPEIEQAPAQVQEATDTDNSTVAAQAAQTKSIAVLPFVNMSADIENEFFSDGIAEEILNVLASIPTLKVAARTSAFAYKGTNTNISTIAEELGVNHILEGSVRKAGNQVRVTVQLIKADDGFHLWSASYDRELTNIFAIQDEIAGSIAAALKLSLDLESGASGNLTGTNSIEAYEHYLQGMSLWHLRTANSLTSAIEEFESAVSLDPDFAKAHAGLALSWAVIDGYIVMDSTVTHSNTIAASERALALDAGNVEALVARASVIRYMGNSSGDAVALFKRAIALNPSFATAHQWYGWMLGDMGDPEAGLASYRKAWSLDPRSRIIGNNLADRLDGLGRHAEAIEVLNDVIEFAPDFPDSLGLMMTMDIVAGNCANAVIHGARLATLLNKAHDSLPVYRDLCQSDNPEAREAAAETILGWGLLDFAASSHPSLSYDADIIVIFMELGLFDAAWTIIKNEPEGQNYLLPWLRTRQSKNAIRFRCDPRVLELSRTADIPPAIHPVSCD